MDKDYHGMDAQPGLVNGCFFENCIVAVETWFVGNYFMEELSCVYDVASEANSCASREAWEVGYGNNKKVSCS